MSYLVRTVVGEFQIVFVSPLTPVKYAGNPFIAKQAVRKQLSNSLEIFSEFVVLY